MSENVVRLCTQRGVATLLLYIAIMLPVMCIEVPSRIWHVIYRRGRASRRLTKFHHHRISLSLWRGVDIGDRLWQIATQERNTQKKEIILRGEWMIRNCLPCGLYVCAWVKWLMVMPVRCVMGIKLMLMTFDELWMKWIDGWAISQRSPKYIYIGAVGSH